MVNFGKYGVNAAAILPNSKRALIPFRKQFRSSEAHHVHLKGTFTNILTVLPELCRFPWTVNEYYQNRNGQFPGHNLATICLNFLNPRQYFVFPPLAHKHNANRKWGCRVVSGMVLVTADDSKSDADRSGWGKAAKIKIDGRTGDRGSGHRLITTTMFAAPQMTGGCEPPGRFKRAMRAFCAQWLKEMTMIKRCAIAGPINKVFRRGENLNTPNQALCFGQHASLNQFC